jgi:5-azacytidine-induced protein 1
LIEDKKTLAERCDTLTLEMSNTDRKCQESLKSTEQRHSAEIRRLKSLQETSNKLKQEKWVDEKTRRIKEQTVRGLEPEIQRLLARHNAELADLEAERERRLNAQERELHQRHLQHIRELRTQWEDENAEGWIHERQLLNQR